MTCTNYNQTKIKTVLKGIIKKVPLQKKKKSKASQDVFYVRIAISQSLW